MNSKLTSVALYASPLFFAEPLAIQKRLESIILMIDRWIFANNTFLMSTEEICQKIKSDTPSQTLLKNNVKYIVKLINEREVPQLTDMLTITKRHGSIIYMKEPKKQNLKSSLDRQIYALPNELKTLSNEKLKRQLKKTEVKFKD